MLGLTKKTGYGLVAMAHLAGLEGDKLASAREIAERYDVPTALLMNVLKKLSTTGYVESVRGAHGGYHLAHRPEEINLAELITALEGPIRLAECISGQTDDADQCGCKLMASCPIVDPIHRVQRKLSDFFKTMTLAEIVEPSATLSEK